MKEYICKKDFYVLGEKFSSIGDHVVLLPDNTTVVNNNGKQKVTKMPEILSDKEFFCPTFETPKFNVDNLEDDNVNHPKHYTSGGIECIDAMIAAYGKEAVMSFCKCNAFKYQWRFDKKNGTEDIKKAQWYQNKYIELSSE